MDKCPKNMTLVALNIFGLITILDFFQDTFLKLKDPQIFSLSCFVEGKLIFLFLYLASWVVPLALGLIFCCCFGHYYIPKNLQKLTIVAISQNSILPKCHSPTSLLLVLRYGHFGEFLECFWG